MLEDLSVSQIEKNGKKTYSKQLIAERLAMKGKGSLKQQRQDTIDAFTNPFDRDAAASRAKQGQEEREKAKKEAKKHVEAQRKQQKHTAELTLDESGETPILGFLVPLRDGGMGIVFFELFFQDYGEDYTRMDFIVTVLPQMGERRAELEKLVQQLSRRSILGTYATYVEGD